MKRSVPQIATAIKKIILVIRDFDFNNDQIRVLVFDEAQRTQDINDPIRTRTIGKAIDKILSNPGIKRNARLILLSGSNNTLPAEEFCKFIT